MEYVLGIWRLPSCTSVYWTGCRCSITDVKREVPAIGHHSESKTRFSAMGSLGVTFDMERFAVDIAARYNYVDINSGLHNFGGDIGIRFMF